MTHAVYYDYTLNGVDSVSNLIPESQYADPDGDDITEIEKANQFLENLFKEGAGADQVLQYNKFDAFWNLTGDDLGDYSRFIYYVTYVD
jgi:hypothetical protein